MTIKLKKNPKISWKNLKLKQKTQNSRKKLKVREDFPSPCLPSGVKKKPAIMHVSSIFAMGHISRGCKHKQQIYIPKMDLLSRLLFQGLQSFKVRLCLMLPNPADGNQHPHLSACECPRASCQKIASMPNFGIVFPYGCGGWSG